MKPIRLSTAKRAENPINTIFDKRLSFQYINEHDSAD
jgi:hypothetical protein